MGVLGVVLDVLGAVLGGLWAILGGLWTVLARRLGSLERPEGEHVDLSLVLSGFGGPGRTARPPTAKRAEALERSRSSLAGPEGEN